MSMHLLEQLHRNAAERGDSVAVRQVAPACVHVETMTFARLLRAVNAAAHQLSLLSSPGDVVVLQAPNSPEFIVSYVAALQADLTVFPVYAQSTEFELRNAISAAGARIYVGGNVDFARSMNPGISYIPLSDVLRFPPTDDESVKRSGRHGAMLLHSSGTTGAPRIVLRTAKALDAVAQNICAGIGIRSTDRVLAAIPLYHSYGVEHGLLAPIAAGCSVHLCDGFDPATVCKQLATGGITVFPAVPFMIEALGDRASSAPSLRRVYSAGGPLPRSASDAFLRRTGVRVGQVYGSTEAGSLTFNDPDQPDFDPQSVGNSLSGVEIRVVEPDAPTIALSTGCVGEVIVSAPSMLKKYINDESELIDGFLRTGDLGSLDHAGNLTIVGRVKLQINIGGAKVNPLEVERVIHNYPGVLECAVIPIRVTDTVDRLKAVIVLDNKHEFIVDDLRAFVRTRLAPFKVPRVFEVRQSLPKSPTGKILREALRCE